ncbi:hypothetical protein D3C81_1458200 [compost metagenome]
MPVAQHHVRPVRSRGARRHGMPVDQNRAAMTPQRRPHQVAEGFMIGLMHPGDPPSRLLPRQAAVVERRAIAGQARNDAVSGLGLQPRRRRRRHPVDQDRVQFLRRTVQIDIGSAYAPGDQRRPRRRARAQQPIHRSILGAAQRHLGQSLGRRHVFGIELPRMRRGEHQRRRTPAKDGDKAEGRVGRRWAHGLAID